MLYVMQQVGLLERVLLSCTNPVVRCQGRNIFIENDHKKMCNNRQMKAQEASSEAQVIVPSAVAITVGTEAPTARIAPVPGGRIASKHSIPIMPMLLTVNVPEEYSSGDSCLPRALFTRSCMHHHDGTQFMLIRTS
jgi:hypothetical protein